MASTRPHSAWFAMVVRDDGTIVRDAAPIRRGEHLRIRLAKGALGVTVEEVE